MTKKVISLLMALMLAFSVISISAYAEEDEGIDHHVLTTRCERCGGDAKEFHEVRDYKFPINGCQYTDGYHRDHYKYYYKGFSCSCGWKTGDDVPYRVEFIGCVPY